MSCLHLNLEELKSYNLRCLALGDVIFATEELFLDAVDEYCSHHGIRFFADLVGMRLFTMVGTIRTEHIIEEGCNE